MKELTIILFCFIFYLFLPLWGAYFERNKWRKFRKMFIKSSKFPILKYKDVVNSQDELFRFFGYLESIEANNKLWIKNKDLSVSVDLENVDIYLLPFSSDNINEDNVENNNYLGLEDRPIKTSWKRLNSLSEKTKVFAFGKLVDENNKKVFKNSKEAPLFLVIHDCSDDCILRRSVWSGRALNEYWNTITPASLCLASFLLFIYSYILLRIPSYKFLAILSLNFSLLPFLPFLPPGLFLYFIYKIFWKKARLLRAEKALLKLPLKYFENEEGETVKLVDDVRYTRKKYKLFHEALKSVELDYCRIRFSSAQKKDKEKEYYVFGQEKDSCFIKPSDPMVELVIINGEPGALSELNNKKASSYEFYALIFFTLGLLINFYLSFRIIRSFIM